LKHVSVNDAVEDGNEKPSFMYEMEGMDVEEDFFVLFIAACLLLSLIILNKWNNN